MPKIETFIYERKVKESGLSYFNDGIRKCIFLNIKDENKIRIGEISLLDKLHKINFDEVLNIIKNIKPYMLKNAYIWPKNQSVISLALSMARYDFCFEKMNKNEKIFLSGLINNEDIENALKKAKYLKDLGVNTFKIKVKNDDLDREIEKIQIIYEKIRPKYIRIDANKSLNLLEAKKFIKAIKNLPIEYLEEPLIDINKTKDLIDDTGINVAIDESYFLFDDIKKIANLGVKYLILKPSLFGDVEEIVNLSKKAQKLSINIIFSNCFESPYFSSFSALLISKLNLTKFTHGIFEQDFFETDSLDELPVRKGCLLTNDCLEFIRNFSTIYNDYNL